MTLNIKLTAAKAGSGVNFNTYLTAQFNGFTPYQMPFFLEQTGSTETTQILHLDTPVTGREANTRVVLLEGDDFLYTFSNHTVSGTIDTIRLGRLGNAWNASASDLALTNGLVTNMASVVTISGLNITNAAGIAGDVHEIVSGMMGGGPSGTDADADPILDAIWSEAHNVTGTAWNDTYMGTRFGDTVRGGGGADTLYGRAGADVLLGGAGKDRLIGGNGADRIEGGTGADILTGGAGSDRFVFRTGAEVAGDRITDFSVAQNDIIDLSAIDANENAAGNQAFRWIGSGAFTGVAGQLRYQVTGSDTRILLDTDGDRSADFSMALTGKPALQADDFIL